MQPNFTKLRLFKDFTPAPEGLLQPSQYLSELTKIPTNTEMAMLSTPLSVPHTSTGCTNQNLLGLDSQIEAGLSEHLLS